MDWQILIPAPLAAPETPGLKRARYLTIAGCLIFALCVLFFGELRVHATAAALPVVVMSGVFTLVQGLQWVTAKNAADLAHLYKVTSDDE